jgi:uncharacterized repeat protein (TIGR01451 family)
VGGVSTLTFTLTNPNAGFALTGVAFTDTFPAGLEVAAPPNATTIGCGSPAFAPAAGNTSVSFSAGTIAASGACTVTVDVSATTAGPKVNTTSNVTSTNGGTGNTGTDTLDVMEAAVAAVKSSTFVAAQHDLDGNGVLSPGDRLLYTIEVRSVGTGDALDVVFTDTPDPSTTLVAGSVTTTQGTITSGNAGGDTTITVSLGTLPATTGQATITFLVQLADPFPVGVTTVENQGTVEGSNFPDVLTDDPDTTPSGDPTTDTVTVAVQSPNIPTVSGWGAILFGLLLAGTAAWRLRQLRPAGL